MKITRYGGYLQAIVNSLDDEVLVIDRDHRILLANEAVLAGQGKSAAEIIGKGCYLCHGLTAPCRSPRHRCPAGSVWRTGKPARVTHLHVHHVNGERQERYFDIVLSPIRDGCGKVTALAELMCDVTGVKELESKLAGLDREMQRQDAVRGELLREVLSIQEEERRRIARELHDETSQMLASLTVNVEAVIAMLPASADEARARLRKVAQQSVRMLDEITRVIYELRPTLLDDLGLVAAARWLVDNKLTPAGIAVSFNIVGRERRLPSDLEAGLFRVIQEAVGNIARHAGARNAFIAFHFKRNAIRVGIRDDGRGFDVEEAITSKDRPRGLGLVGMKERAELMNGSLSLRSYPGRGTEIDIEVPTRCEKASRRLKKDVKAKA
ncbi:MAG: PAS domain-containing protein [Chloroflexi bacterium]|nr:PAS domain-containing protein [Chloroflexota bacterium]